MLRNNTFGIFVAALSALLPIAALAAAATPNYGQVIDISAEAVPTKFKGNDCRAITQELNKVKLTKTEFETTEQFQARLSAFRATTKIPGLREGSYVAFVDQLAPEKLTYDADQATMKVDISDGILGSFSAKLATSGFTAFSKITHERSYNASNAYGKTVSVKSRLAAACAVGFINRPYDALKSAEIVPISMPATEARVVKSRLSALYIGTLADPFLEKFEMYRKPTIDSPSEFAMTGDTVLISVAELWIYDPASGKIYMRIKR